MSGVVVSPYGQYCRDRVASLSNLLTTPSLRQLWKMCKALLASGEEFAIDQRDLVLARNSFYIAASGIPEAPGVSAQAHRYDELDAMIERHGRQIDNLIKPSRRARH